MQRSGFIAMTVLLGVLILAFGVVQASHTHAIGSGCEDALAQHDGPVRVLDQGSVCLLCTLSAGFAAVSPHGVQVPSPAPCRAATPLQERVTGTPLAVSLLLRGPPALFQLG